MRIQLIKIKADQKVRALEIKRLKSLRKDKEHNHGTGYVRGLLYLQEDYRAYHIAYCMLRGKTLEQIESKIRDPNSYVHTRVRKQATQIVADILNPKPPVVEKPKQVVAQPITQEKQETLWDKVVNFLF